MNKKGFTLVELLATMAILSIIMGIAVMAYSSIVENNRLKVFKTYEKTMYSETMALMEDALINPDFASLFPKNFETKHFTISELIDYGMDPIKNPRNSEDTCSNSYVEVTREDYQDSSSSTYNDSLIYKVCLICPESGYNVSGNDCLNVPEYNLSDNPVIQNITNTEEAEEGACSKVSWTDPDDGTTYYSGSNECINNNYVWYSGKLWRITSVYADGAMKLVTENNITTIAFNSSGRPAFYGSYVYQWLNEDFYSTLYKPEQFIDSSKPWNATITANSTDKPARTTMVNAKVGLLNSFDYYNSYRCNENSSCNGSNINSAYLNIKYSWWLLNPSNSSQIRYIYDDGHISDISTIFSVGVRPSIVLKPRVKFTGAGTINNPYKVVGDKEVGKPDERINTRLSGEYVLLKSWDGTNSDLFRIVSVEDDKTKIISVDYADNRIKKLYSTNSVNGVIWGSGTTLNDGTWYTYLNNTYFPNMKSKYDNLFTDMVYYLGECGYNYKQCVCATASNLTTKDCEKTSSQKNIYVGLPLYGEMFSAQQAGGRSNSCHMWTISANNNRNVWEIVDANRAGNIDPAVEHCGRPTLHLKKWTQIRRGSGTINDPYEVYALD